jgi:hypothetical protein
LLNGITSFLDNPGKDFESSKKSVVSKRKPKEVTNDVYHDTGSEPKTVIFIKKLEIKSPIHRKNSRRVLTWVQSEHHFNPFDGMCRTPPGQQNFMIKPIAYLFRPV